MNDSENKHHVIVYLGQRGPFWELLNPTDPNEIIVYINRAGKITNPECLTKLAQGDLDIEIHNGHCHEGSDELVAKGGLLTGAFPLDKLGVIRNPFSRNFSSEEIANIIASAVEEIGKNQPDDIELKNLTLSGESSEKESLHVSVLACSSGVKKDKQPSFAERLASKLTALTSINDKFKDIKINGSEGNIAIKRLPGKSFWAAEKTVLTGAAQSRLRGFKRWQPIFDMACIATGIVLAATGIGFIPGVMLIGVGVTDFLLPNIAESIAINVISKTAKQDEIITSPSTADVCTESFHSEPGQQLEEQSTYQSVSQQLPKPAPHANVVDNHKDNETGVELLPMPTKPQQQSTEEEQPRYGLGLGNSSY